MLLCFSPTQLNLSKECGVEDEELTIKTNKTELKSNRTLSAPSNNKGSNEQSQQ